MHFSKKSKGNIFVIICVILYNKSHRLKPFLFYYIAASLIALDYIYRNILIITFLMQKTLCGNTAHSCSFYIVTA